MSAQLDLTVSPASRTANHCSKNFPEFAGKQQKVSRFFNAARPDVALKEPETKKAKVTAVKKQAKMSSFFKTAEKPVVLKPTSRDTKDDSFCAVEAIEKVERRATAAGAWKALFKGPAAPPECKGHGEPAVLRTVKKKGPNMNRQFWCCARGEGKAGDPEARCDFFKWVVSGK